MPLLDPTPALAVLSPGNRPRYEPRNLAFADGLEGWRLGAAEITWHRHLVPRRPGRRYERKTKRPGGRYKTRKHGEATRLTPLTKVVFWLMPGPA